MKRLLTTIIILMALTATPAIAAEDLSIGCADEITGEAGVMNGTGECVTPAEYDAKFSFDNLDSIVSLTDPTQTIAREAGIVDVKASVRELGIGLVDVPFTFTQIVGAYRPL